MIFFYTVTSPQQVHLCENLKKSLSRYHQELTILPIYEKNNFSKLKINDVLQNLSYKDEDIIVICDGFDVVCAKDPQNIQTYFDNNTDTDILFSSENMFGNNLVCIKEYYDKYNSVNGTSGKYLNAGVIMGRANKIKQFYKNLTSEIDALKEYIPHDRHDTTGDQTFIINYLYHINFMVNYKNSIKYKIDLKDELTFTNTITDRKFNINDYVFIHTWGIYISDPNYKYIKDQQYQKWSQINKILDL
jgi:hypothetical protein